ncbi:FHA domain-containing protein [Humibacillus xanthopallidus]|uniref:FHA domain-containing protein n=1 Tax=Humibacillus xanthopallidus TaxID=412689 RepID=UPI00384AB9C8
MHLLIALDEDDEQTLVASDAADGGDLDDVLDVLTTGGMRRARHFVGVHWQPRTRLVAHGPVAVMLTLADGSEHEVRATSPRVWTDVELPEHPTHVRLRVLDETEAKQPPSPALPPVEWPRPPAHPVEGALPTEHPVEWALSTGHPVEWALSTDPGSDPATDAAETTVETADSAAPVRSAAPAAPAASVGPVVPVPPVAPADPVARVVPTFGGSAATGSTGSRVTSPWQRSWAQHSPSAATTASAAAPPPPPPAPSPPAPALLTPAPQPPTPDPVAPQSNSSAIVAPPAVVSETPRASGPDAMAVEVDVESTLSGRPLPEPDSQREHSDIDDGSDSGEVAPPSYDYLFGLTTTVDEHRRVLAELERPADDEQDDDGHPAVAVAEPPVSADAGPAALPEASPAVGQALPAAPTTPTVAAEPVPPADGGLISSVPWARPAATGAPGETSDTADPADPQPAPEVPTFAGRHTPPPAPSLLPPAIAAPPGTRPPTTAPIITTGPPPPAEPAEPATPPSAATPVGHGDTPSERESDPRGRPASQGDAAEAARAAAPAGDTPARTPEVTPALAADTPAVDGAGAGDEAELTVDRSALIQAREAARSRVSTGPSVLAVLCSAGHPTPPHGERCRVCGSGIPPQEPFAMPRPPLGVLRLSTGDVVTLDRSVLLGRAPRLSESHSAAERPHVVKVPSPERDVSRNHVEVVLEGWHVLIRDLGTTNGTTVTLPGETPVRLRANDQQVLEAGSLVSMADEVSFVFEAAP